MATTVLTLGDCGCCNLAHCGAVTANATGFIGGWRRPLGGDVGTYTISEGATEGEIGQMTDLLSRYCPANPWFTTSPGGYGATCSSYDSQRYLIMKYTAHGTVWDSNLDYGEEPAEYTYDYVYDNVLNPRYQEPMGAIGLEFEKLTTHTGPFYEGTRNTDTGAMNLTVDSEGFVSDAYGLSDDYEAAYPIDLAALCSEGGSMTLEIEDTGFDLSTCKVTLTINVPADYLGNGGPAATRTRIYEFSGLFGMNDLEDLVKELLEAAQFETPGHIYTDEDSLGPWTSEDGGNPRRMVWGLSYEIVWSSLLNIWPNRPLVSEFITGTPTAWRFRAANRLIGIGTVGLVKALVGIAEGDSGCLVSYEELAPNFDVSGLDYLDECGDHDPEETDESTCVANALEPGVHILTWEDMAYPIGFMYVIRNLSQEGIGDNTGGPPSGCLPDPEPEEHDEEQDCCFA